MGVLGGCTVVKLYALLVSLRASNAREYHFVEEMALDLEERLLLGCAVRQQGQGHDAIVNAVRCASDESCVGVSKGPDSFFLHYDCPDASPSGRFKDLGHRLYRKTTTSTYCLHGGVWRTKRGRCACRHGWIGQHCAVMAASCRDLAIDQYPNDAHFVNLDVRNDPYAPLWVVCRTNPTSLYTYVLVANNVGKNAYNKTHSQFVDGFGSQLDEMWIGLEAMHALTQAGYAKVNVDVTILTNQTKMHFYSRHRLSISNSSTGYSMTSWEGMSYSRGDALGYRLGNCFETLQGISFSSWDRDNDLDPARDCASLVGNGWWYQSCSPSCNLLGRDITSHSPGSPSQVLKLPGLDLQAMHATSVRIKWYMLRP